MGVQGLWQLLQPVARPIKIETLEGKRLAIDSSLWLYHFQMAMRDKEGRTLSNAHILGFLWRILKLLFHGVRPVFVFDGGAPVMKRKTLSGRKARKQGAKESHARTAEKLLNAQMRQAAIKHVAEAGGAPPRASSSTDNNADSGAGSSGLGENTVYYDDLQAGRPTALPSRDLHSGASPSSAPQSRENSSSPSKPGARKVDWHKDPYALPAMEKDLNQVAAANGRKGKRKDYRFATEAELRAVMNTIAPEDLDTTSELFRSLPPELQYELVGDLRAQSRMTSYKRLQSMLATAPTPIDFSRAQIAGLKTRNDLTQKVLTVTDEIGNANIKVPIRVAGERNKEYVLVRNPGAEGGFVLGVRDAGTSQDKAIDVDYEPQEINITDDEHGHSDSEPEIEMDDVEIPASASPSRIASAAADPEMAELQKEADPHVRKEKALELLQARARQHAKQKRREAGLLDDDDGLERDLPRRRKRGERPLFIRNPRAASGSSQSPQNEWIDVDADSDADDDFSIIEAGVDELEEDEAEDLARAIAESSAAQSGSEQHRAGLKLVHRSGEPVSLHDAMLHRDDSSQARREVAPRATAPLEVENQAALDVDELNDDDFEDVQPEPLSALQEVEPGFAAQPTAVSSRTDANHSGRMQELAALANRHCQKSVDATQAPPPPRKSLAGSLRAARRTASSSAQPSIVVADDEPQAQVPAPEKSSEPPLRSARMGPPLRSASQQRLELAHLAPGSSEPVEMRGDDLSTTPEDVNRQIASEAGSDAQRVGEQPQSRQSVDDPPAPELVEQTTLAPSTSEAVEMGHDDLPPTPEEVNRQIAIESRSDEAEEQAQTRDELQPRESALDAPPASEVVELEPEQPSVDHGLPTTNDVESDTAAGDAAGLEDVEETGVPVSLSVPEQASAVAQGVPHPDAGGAVDDVVMDNMPAAAAEQASSALQDNDPVNLDERQTTPVEWSPTPSPEREEVVIGADGFPLPTAAELDALSASDDDIARLSADQSEFVAFLSATKGRSLLDVQQQVESEVNALRAEFANSRRSEEDITKQMAQEIQMMLRLFGLPYITAPMEAEAQCAELVSRRLVDGIITDDSDVFLFGGTRIYKNMFNNNRIVECFLLSDMQRELGLDREKLVRLAYYLGSDYTEGLAGVGPVVAMELLALFPGEDGLLKFREWWMRVQTGQDTHEHTRGKTMRRIKKNLRNKVHLEPSWPEPAVLDAYYAPTVDESEEPFAWGLPDLDSLRTFLGEYLHWPVSKTDQYVLPIIERQNARTRARGNQTTLDRGGFFDTSAGTGVYAGRRKITYGSNRLQEVINGFRAANGRKPAPARNPRRRGSADTSSGSDDDVQVVGARLATPAVAEEMLGKEMAKKRPIVRRDEGGAETNEEQTSAARTAELDAAIEALEGRAAAVGGGSGAKPASAGRGKRKKRAAREEEALSSSASSSEEEARLERVGKAARGRGRGRGRARARGRGSGRGRSTLHAARNMSLDDIDTLPPSRSPSVDASTLRARTAAGVRRSSTASSRSTPAS
ncbi:flap structure-specific endonuclease [Moesziomyces antarcticus]|uniref:Flap structure-specific endonuclease n=2 Tax=Pseudozyma antarctica TaxID=84753 RepID=A0A081CNT1_PSEA2|nr:flap structure-specific endonuclease [Moesziomyces antarcticus]GAK68327.1 flap structure-specific endonuclease [Moesziomyces antarcticus]SPO46986.1 related to RAD2 - structure-specific nuclease of the nucleotide excision repairosome [Moesziomyces antarcticus]